MTNRARSVNAAFLHSSTKMAQSIKNPEPSIIAQHKDYIRYGGLLKGMKKFIPSNIKETTEAPEGLRLMANQKLVYNADNGYIMSMMGKDYAVVSHLETVQATMEIFRQQGIDIDACPSMLNINSYGRVVNLRIILNEMCATPKDGKPIYGCFEFTNSLDGKTSIDGTFKALRLICTNGMISSRELLHFKAIHSLGSLQGVDVAGELANLSSGFLKSVEFYDELIGEKLNRGILDDMFYIPAQIGNEEPKKSIAQKVLGVSIAEGTKEIINTGRYGGFEVPGINTQNGTLYDAFNAITGMAHTKANYKSRNAVETSALDFVDAYKQMK